MPFNNNQTTRFGADPLLAQELATKAYVDSMAGGGGIHKRAMKNVSQGVASSTVLIDDDDFFFDIDADKWYGGFIRFGIRGVAAAGWKMTFTGPATLAVESEFERTGVNGINLIPFGTPFSHGIFATPIIMGQTIFFRVRSDSAGTVNYQWAQTTSNATPTEVVRGSYMLVWEQE